MSIRYIENKNELHIQIDFSMGLERWLRDEGCFLLLKKKKV